MNRMESDGVDRIYIIAVTMALEGEIFALLVVLDMLDCNAALDGAHHIPLTVWKACDTPVHSA